MLDFVIIIIYIQRGNRMNKINSLFIYPSLGANDKVRLNSVFVCVP